MDQNQNHGIEQIPADEMAFCYTGINVFVERLTLPKCDLRNQADLYSHRYIFHKIDFYVKTMLFIRVENFWLTDQSS